MRKVLTIVLLLVVFPVCLYAKDSSSSSRSDITKDPNFKSTWEILSKSGETWPQIKDEKLKAEVIAMYIQIYKQNGIKITNSPVYYTKRIDGLYKENQQIFSNPLNIILQTMAIMDYDFDNHQDKDLLAKQLLGEKGYMANKKRLGMVK